MICVFVSCVNQSSKVSKIISYNNCFSTMNKTNSFELKGRLPLEFKWIYSVNTIILYLYANFHLDVSKHFLNGTDITFASKLIEAFSITWFDAYIFSIHSLGYSSINDLR